MVLSFLLNTDLSAIGNGTVTGAISWLNTNKNAKISVVKVNGPSGALAIPVATWTICVSAASFSAGTYILFGWTNHAVNYLRIAKYNDISAVYCNTPYGKLVFGTYTFTETTLVSLWCYTGSAFTMGATEAGILGIKIS